MFKRFADWLTSLLFKEDRQNWIAILTVFFIIVSPVILVAVFSYVKTYQDLTDFALSRRQSIAYLAATNLKEKFERLVDLGVSLATRVRFRQLIAAQKWEEAIGILREVPDDFPFIERVFLTDRDGTLMADTPKLPDVRGKNFAYRGWYQGVSQKWEPYISEVYRRAAKPQYNVIATAVPIKADKDIVGILVLQIKLDTLFEWSKSIEIGPSGFVFFVDKKGRVAAHPKFSPEGGIMDFSTVPSVQRALAGERGVAILYNPVEKEERLSAYEPVPGYGWGVVAQQPVSAAFAPRDSSLRNILLAYILVGLFSAFLAYLVLRAFARQRQSEKEVKKLNRDLRH